MQLRELFMADLERERPITRKAVAAVPEGKGDWKPHEKSMPLGRLTGLVAMMPGWLTMMIGQDEFDVAPPAGQSSPFSKPLTTREELLKAVDAGFDGATQALQSTSDDHLMQPWRLKARGVVVAEGPRHVMMRDALMHLAHHRGQLTVYIRLNGAAVPALYGPSADEQTF
ncbi:MAG TPA: DinB family protein [Vicinamibacterales bacterium]|jgi:uncharacterized damage-inducible protein DinB